MNFGKHLVSAVLMTGVTTGIYGLAYPLAVTALAQLLFSHKANGQLIMRDGTVVGSAIIGQPFTSTGYFHGRPSAAGAKGYDATASGGTNLGPTSKKLVEAVVRRVAEARAENPSTPVPIDLVTSSGSGLDPDISPAAALFQAPRVARARDADESAIRELINAHIMPRQLGMLGEPRVNVLLLNLTLDERFPGK